MPHGRTARSILSMTSEGEGDMEMFEAELEKLQRTYRIMDGDRQAYALESQDIIRKHLAEIATLKREREEMLKNLTLVESKYNQDKDKSNVTKLQKLLEENDEVLNEIDQERELHAKQEEEIRQLEHKVHQQRISSGGAQATKNLAQQTLKKMAIFENRLHRAQSKFNSVLADNTVMREEIETMRIEKGKFQQMYKKNHKELHDLKKEVGQVVEASTLAYDQRDESHSKIFLLKEKSDKDLQLFNAEIKELQRVIDHDKRLRDFMLAKEYNRPHTSPSLKKEKDERKRGDGKISIQSYESAFKNIEEISGNSNIDDIVADFIQVEDSNFALFNYVNEQNNEIELLYDDIEEIRDKIKQFKNEGYKMDVQRKRILRDLDTSRKAAAEKCQQNERMLTTTLKILDQLKLGIGSLFKRIGCDSTALCDLLGGTEGVKDDNMMQYLGLIEQRANELLAAQSYLNSKDFEKPFDPSETARYILGQVPVTPVQPLLIAPPSTGDLRLRAQRNKLLASVLHFKDDYDSDDIEEKGDEDHRPLTKKELKERIMKGVLKKEAVASKKGFRYDLSAAAKRN